MPVGKALEGARTCVFNKIRSFGEVEISRRLLDVKKESLESVLKLFISPERRQIDRRLKNRDVNQMTSGSTHVVCKRSWVAFKESQETTRVLSLLRICLLLRKIPFAVCLQALQRK